jgi:hypothetical protein
MAEEETAAGDDERTEPMPIDIPDEESGSKVWIAWLVAALVVVAGIIAFIMLNRKQD